MFNWLYIYHYSHLRTGSHYNGGILSTSQEKAYVYTRIDFARISKESSNCFKACSNLCRSFSIVSEGVSDIRWLENGTNHKGVASKQQNAFNFFVSMKYKTLHTSKNIKAAVLRSTKVCYTIIGHNNSSSSLMVTANHFVFQYSPMMQYIIAQWYVLIVQKLCALATVYLLLFQLNRNE